MSLTRKALVAMGIESEKIEQIIEMHLETVNALKDERDSAKENAEKYEEDSKKLANVQKELDEFKANANKPDEYKEKYDKVKKEFDDYKSGIKSKELKDKKKDLYTKLLKESKVSEKRIPAILRLTDLEKIELSDDNESIKNSDEQKELIAKEWSDYIVSVDEQGADKHNPPEGDNNDTKLSNAAQKAINYRNSLYGTPKED